MNGLTTSQPTAFSRILKRPTAVLCLIFLILIVLLVFLGPLFTGHDDAQTSKNQFSPPNCTHLFGTDLNGRDVFTRVLSGGQISLIVGFIGTLVSLFIGVTYGLISGYWGGRVDTLMMRFVDILYSLPRIIFVSVFITVLDAHLQKILTKLDLEFLASQTRILLLFVGLGALSWLTMARIVRGQVLALKENQFILAAQALGTPKIKILVRHLLPNLIGIIIVYLTLTIPVVILEESLLSFLGLGIQPPQASWGSLISDGASAINPIKMNWWLIFFPGITMGLTLLALNILGDHLRDVYDPKTAKK